MIQQLIQQRKEFGVFLAAVSLHRSVLKSHLYLRRAIAEEVHFSDFVDPRSLSTYSILSVSSLLFRSSESQNADPRLQTNTVSPRFKCMDPIFVLDLSAANRPINSESSI